MDESFYVGICTECHSDQPASYMERSPFNEPPCRFCGGVVQVIRHAGDEQRHRRNREDFLNNKDVERGIYHPPNSEDKDA